MSTATRKGLLEGYLIEQTAKKMKLAFSQALSAKGIDATVDQWIILDTLIKYGPSSQQEISIKTNKDAPTVTRMLDLMEKKGVLERINDPSDRRRFLISLTAVGKKIVKQIQPLSVAFRSQCYDGLTNNEINQLKKSLDTICQNLK